MLMENPMFPRQPWFWDPPEDGGQGETSDGACLNPTPQTMDPKLDTPSSTMHPTPS